VLAINRGTADVQHADQLPPPRLCRSSIKIEADLCSTWNGLLQLQGGLAANFGRD